MKNTLLSTIHDPSDLRKLDPKELKELAAEIRSTIIEVVGKNGGHLSSNLGVVELTIALHRVFETPRDAIVWDVGHQCYTHKLLTGRYGEFSTLRRRGGLSGFPKRAESPHDAFDTGHASTSISAALGLLCARRQTGADGKVVAVIGDGALTGGLALEALSHAGQLKKDLIVILNDNKMSIGRSTGAISIHLSKMTVSQPYQRFRRLVDQIIENIPFFSRPLSSLAFRFKRALKGIIFHENLFADLGFEYCGPIDGYDIKEMERTFAMVKKQNRPVVVHVLTKKGRGYRFSEENPAAFHGVGPFNTDDGALAKIDSPTFTQCFSEALLELGEKDPRVAVISAAMAEGTGTAAFQSLYPERFFDVGIAEEHAVTFAAGLAAGGLRPIAAIYSTFIQRAADQIIHDVALQSLPVIFVLDRAGAVPYDGETHQGAFDISLFYCVPALTLLAPASARELRLMLDWARNADAPVVIRYPKAACPEEEDAFSEPLRAGRGVFVNRKNADTLIVCAGGIYPEAARAVSLLEAEGISADIYNLRFLKPLDERYIAEAWSSYKNIIFAEDGMALGGVGTRAQAIARDSAPSIRTRVLGFADRFYPQGDRAQILAEAGLSAEALAQAVKDFENADIGAADYEIAERSDSAIYSERGASFLAPAGRS